MEMTKFCGGCKLNKDHKDFYNNKKKADGKQTQCKLCMKDQNKKNYVKHKKTWNKRSAEYRKTEKWKEYKRNYMNKRYKKDISFRILTRMRNRTREAIRTYGGKKCTSTLEFIGCSVEELCTHLESKFHTGMSWDNIHLWDIDHITPCSSFDMSDETDQRKCFHYTNLQPLWRADNIRKSNTIPASAESEN